ncbi:Putative helicase, P-loop containing nucleoside triphosphate hydrolase, SNF2-like domain superfamily [Septoria linicola]|uniref:DNA helicase n=1 Tax=Septoria linicola TaxID=215465 RepID=A0A9Q9ARC7_9PEZI|nr:Putative helicase, P-loop containing nucleoside triphosphate hydrolase, SNF2-like domain superfamily [Septoria linicola]
MADRFDPISDGTPAKRRKLNGSSSQKAWDSNEDSGDDFTPDDFHPATIPTQQKNQLNYSSTQFHSELGNSSGPRGSPQSFTTQPTQTLKHVTQPTQPMQSEVQVQRSSPAAPSPQRPMPQPIRNPLTAPHGARGGLLASAMAPPGTAFRRPMNAQQQRPTSANADSDDDDDPPVQHQSQPAQPPQYARAALKPTDFKRAGARLPSSPSQMLRIQESPRANTASAQPMHSQAMNPQTMNTSTPFMHMLNSFTHRPTQHQQPPTTHHHHPPPPNPLGYHYPQQAAYDSASAYGNSTRMPRPPQMYRPHHPAQGMHPGAALHGPQYPRHLHEIQDYLLRQKVQSILSVLPQTQYSVADCLHALEKNRGDHNAAMTWLVDQRERKYPTPDELSSLSPVQRKGVAQNVSQSYSSQPSQPQRPTAKQDIRAKQTIAEKYRANGGRKTMRVIHDDEDSDEDDDVVPRGRNSGRNTVVSSPPSSPPPVARVRPGRLAKKRTAIVISDDEDEDSGMGQDASDGSDGEPEQQVVVDISEDVQEMREERVLKLLNESTVADLAEITAKPVDNIQFVLDQRPFDTLDSVRAIVQETLTKNGKKSKKTKALGEQLVEECIEVMSGYDAVDELVVKCEKMSAPLQEALKAWGVGDVKDGELQIMTLDEAHDSGIGTPASSVADDAPLQNGTKNKRKGKFLGQPENMAKVVVMKDYQLVGLNWLHMLFSKKISCILADDMGLGKTCQIISYLAQLQLEQVDGVHLIIVPGSTLENWLREFQKFAPDMDVRPYYGLQAERGQLQDFLEADRHNIDVIVTTYDMAVKQDDNKFLRKFGPFSVCVYDEAHMLRNPNSDRYTQLTRIAADHKVLLTGTPLQNNLQELIAILAFIMPEMFQEKREDLNFLFKHKATTKDTSSAALLSNERVARARSMMTPFILRRKKHQVLDLPKKDSRVEYCEMTDTQANYYADLLDDFQRVLNEKLAPGAKRSAATNKASSNALMALRKAAIHPLLSRRMFNDQKLDKLVTALSKSEEFGGNPEDKIRAYLDGTAAQCVKGGDFGLHKFCADPARTFLHKRFALKKQEWMDAGKVVKFKELIEAYVKNGDRTLVFSQFTTLMDILEEVLETLNIKFLRLDGSTNMADRQDMIDKFYTDETIPVFMLSTRAGGAGINLAAANKVIIFDSGFNPQDDIQAENRAHRVGQTREVEVVRLVTKGTIEEQIHALGESKLALDERVAGEGATAADEKQAEKAGQQLVEEMFVQKLKKEESKDQETDIKSRSNDLKDAFKKGLEDEGLKVASKQAQF